MNFGLNLRIPTKIKLFAYKHFLSSGAGGGGGGGGGGTITLQV